MFYSPNLPSFDVPLLMDIRHYMKFKPCACAKLAAPKSLFKRSPIEKKRYRKRQDRILFLS